MPRQPSSVGMRWARSCSGRWGRRGAVASKVLIVGAENTSVGLSGCKKRSVLLYLHGINAFLIYWGGLPQ
jgi:hypothetical protein